jgi:uncharacterized protein YybS (DUF2232 family)
VNERAILQRRNRTHAIVEAALLSDIAIVFLLMRVFMPIPPVRSIIRAVATVPFVMLTQRRGFKIAVLAAIASYILFTALVGPILALAAVDIAVAGVLLGIGRRVGAGPVVNALWTGPVYALLDVIFPTVASLFIFRYPVKDLIGSAHNFVKLMFNFAVWIMTKAGAPASAIHQVRSWEGPAVTHWQYAWIGLSVLYGYLIIYLAVLISEVVLRQLPAETLEARAA